MSERKVEVRGGGVGFFSLLTIVFIVLKLTGVIAWSWVWVLAPLWIPALLVLVVAAIVFGVIVWKDSKRG